MVFGTINEKLFLSYGVLSELFILDKSVCLQYKELHAKKMNFKFKNGNICYCDMTKFNL